MNRIALGVVVLLASCHHGSDGGGAPPGPPTTRIGNTTGMGAAAARAHLCDRAKALRDGKCDPFTNIPDEVYADCSVVDGIYIADSESCMDAPTCDAAQACFAKISHDGGTYAGPTQACANTNGSIPAGFTAAEIAASRGIADTKFSDTPSSQQQPIEVCGMPAETAYLARLACGDGSRPFGSLGEADAARVGNSGPGGRCGRILDHYQVPCPERAYDVFIDAYRCLSH